MEEKDQLIDNLLDKVAEQKKEEAPEKTPEKDERIKKREEEKAKSRHAQKLKRRLAELEILIAETEGNIKKIEAEIFSPAVATNYAKIMELTIAKKDLQQKLEALYQEWDKIQAEIEQAEVLATHRLIKKDQ